MNIAIRQGRAFEESDRGRGVAVLSEKAAKLLWPEEPNPVGRRFMGEDDKPKTLVGIVAEVRAALHSDPPPMAYYPYWQRVPDAVALVVRTTADPRSCRGRPSRRASRRRSATADPGQFARWKRWSIGSVAQRRFQLTLDGRLCRFRAAGGQPWDLWRRLLLGGSPPERNRHPDGARRADARNCLGWSFVRV